MTSTLDEIETIKQSFECDDDLTAAFEDESFPACAASIGVYQNDNVFEWHSLNKICNGQPELFVDGVEMDDVVAGELNDGWFLTALSLVATQSSLLRWLFVDQLSKPHHGLYTMRFFVDGEWQLVYVDDRMPCHPRSASSVDDNHHPVFARGKTPNETWMMVLEKGCAKLHGSYGAMEAKSAQCGVAHAVRLLTGGDVGTVATSSISSYAILEAMLRPRQVGVTVLTLAVREDGGAVDAQAADGIIRSHAYTVVDHCQVETEDHIETLVKLRNPWGSQEWSGDWSDSSARWTPEMQARLKHQPVVDDGEFYMSLKDLCKIYTRLVWVQVRPEAGINSWKRSSARCSWKLQSDKQSVHSQGGCPNVLSWWTNPQFSLHVTRPCNLHISLEQPACHLQPQFAGYFTIGFSIFQHAPGDDDQGNMCVLSPSPHMEVVTSEYCAAQAVSACITLYKPGHYKIVPTTLRPGGIGPFSLTVQSLETDLKGKIGPYSKLSQQPEDSPFEFASEPQWITESQRRVMDASFHAMSDRLHIAESAAQQDTVVDLMNLGECGVMNQSQRHWGLVVHIYGRRTSLHSKWVEDLLQQNEVPFIFVDFSLDGNGKLPPHVRDGIRYRVGAEGFQLPVLSAFGEIIVAGLKDPPIGEEDIEQIVLDYQWQHYDTANVMVKSQKTELSKMRLSADVIRTQCDRKIAQLSKKYHQAAVEIDAVSLRFRLDRAEFEKLHAELLLRQVQAEAAAEDKLAVLELLRQEKANNENGSERSPSSELEAEPHVHSVSEIADKIVQRIDEDIYIQDHRLSRCEAAHRAVNNLYSRPLSSGLQPVMEDKLIHDVAEQIMNNMSKTHRRVAGGGRKPSDAASDAVEWLTSPAAKGVAKNQKRPEEIEAEELAAAKLAALKAEIQASRPQSPGSPPGSPGSPPGSPHGLEAETGELWPSPPKPQHRRLVLEVYDVDSPDGVTMSPNARAICSELKRQIADNELPVIDERALGNCAACPSLDGPCTGTTGLRPVVPINLDAITGGFAIPEKSPEQVVEPEPEPPQSPLKIVSVLGADMEPFGSEFGFWIDVDNIEPPKQKDAWFKGEPEPAVWVPDNAMHGTLPLQEWQSRASQRVEGSALEKLKKGKARMATLHKQSMQRWFAERGLIEPTGKDVARLYDKEMLGQTKEARAAATEIVKTELERQFQRVMVYEPQETDLEPFKSKIDQAAQLATKGYSDDFDFKYKYKYAYKYLYTQ